MSVFAASVTVSLVDKVSAGLGSMAKQFTRSETASKALQNRLDKISSTFSRGVLQVGAGAALATPLVFATKEAMKLESAMTRVKAQASMSASELKDLDKVLTKTSNMTGIFSKPMLAQLAGDMFASGLNKKQFVEMLPLFAKAAEVNKIMSKGKDSPEDTVHSLTALAHQGGKYSSKEMTPIAQASIAMSQRLPGGLKSLAATGASVNILGSRVLNADFIDLLAFQAAVAQTSGSKGGGGKGRLSASNQINALVRGAAPGSFGGGLLTGKQAFAAASMGLADKYGASTVMKGDKLDLKLFQEKMEKFQDMSSLEMANRMKTHLHMLGKKAEDEVPLIWKAIKTDGKGVSKAQLMSQLTTYQFGSAGTVALMMGDKKFLAQQNQMAKAGKDAIKNNLIETQMETVSKTLDFQLSRLNTNFETLASTLGTQLLPRLTPIVEKTASLVEKMNAFAEKNPQIIETVETVLAIASGVLILGGALNIVKAAFDGLKFVLSPLLKSIKFVWSAFAKVAMKAGPMIMRVMPWITRIASFVISKLGPIGLAITALILIVTNWDSIVKATKPTWEALCSGFRDLGNALVRLLDVIVSKIPFLNGAKQSWNSLNLGGGGMIPAVAGAAAYAGVNNVAYAQGKRNSLNNSSGGSKGKTTIINSKPTITVNMHQVPGHNHEKCWEHGQKSLTKGLTHAANASSGSSVGRSMNHGGNVRK